MILSVTISFFIAFAVFVTPVSAAVSPVGLWEFDNPSNLLLAKTGADLVLNGIHTETDGIEGPGGSDGAASIGAGSYYSVAHGIAANGGGSYVNEWSLLIDFKYPDLNWISFFQTNQNNANDGDCFVRNSDGKLGLSVTGYSGNLTAWETWYRMVVTVDNGSFYRIYINGNLWLEGSIQPVDGRFSMDPVLLLFADDNSEDNEIHVSEVAIYDQPLTASEVADLKGPGGLEPSLILTQPYLQRVHTGGITVMWELSEIAASSVDYGFDTGYGNINSVTNSASGAGTEVYKSVLTGLSAGTTYHYRINIDGVAGDDRTFTTAPAGEVDFSFVQWGDSQGWSNATTPMMQHMAESGIDIAISTGDMAEDGSSYGSIRENFLNRVINNVGQTIPFDIAWGNHDAYGSSMIKSFTGFGAGNYSFDYANCHFVCIDYVNDNDYNWIEADLAAAGNARHIFVFVHVPPYCERWIDGSADFRINLVPLLEEYNVDICLSGHMHGYQRGELNGVYYIVSGGGSWLDTGEPLTVNWPHMTVGGYHVLGAGIDGGLVNEYVKIDVTGTGWTATMTAFNPDGTLMPGITDIFSKTVISVGDINGDGTLDLADAVIALKILSGVDMSGITLSLDADCNGDGKIGTEDAIYILEKISNSR